MTAAEWALLRQVIRWARAEGVESRYHGWTRRGPIADRWGVSLEDAESPRLLIWRGRANGRDYWVASIAEAVDVLVALGILPARFSTAYRAGWDAGMGYAVTATYGDEYRSIVPAVKRSQVPS